MKARTPTDRIFRGAASGLIFGFFANASLFVGHIIIPRALSRVEYADFNVALSFVVLLSLVADMGMLYQHTRLFAEAEERLHAGAPDDRGRLFGSMVVLRLLLALGVVALAALLAPFLYTGDILTCIWMLLLSLFISSRLLIFRAVGEALLRSQGKYAKTSLYALIDALLFTAALVIPRRDLSLEYVTAVYVLSQLPGFVLLLRHVLMWKKRESLRFSVDRALITQSLRAALPLGLMIAFLTAYNEIDKLLLDKMSSASAVSSYSALLRLALGLNPVPYILAGVMAPELTRLLLRGQNGDAKKLINFSLRVLAFTSVAACLFFTGSHGEIVGLLLGQKYAADASTFQYLNWLLVPLFLGAFLSEMSIAGGEFSISTKYMGLTLAILLLGDVLLLSQYGVMGASIAKLTACSLGCLFLVWLLRRSAFLNVRSLRPYAGKLVLSAFISGLITVGCDFIAVNVWVNAVATAVGFCAMILATRFFSANELRTLLARSLNRMPPPLEVSAS